MSLSHEALSKKAEQPTFLYLLEESRDVTKCVTTPLLSDLCVEQGPSVSHH